MTKLRTTVYLSNMACTVAKLWEKAFQTIPDVSFFDAEEKHFTKILRKKIFGVEKRNVGNRLKRVLAKFGGRASSV